MHRFNTKLIKKTQKHKNKLSSKIHVKGQRSRDKFRRPMREKCAKHALNFYTRRDAR